MSGVFLYDGDSGFCTTSAGWLQRHTTSPARVVAWQHADLMSLGLSPSDCVDAVQWVDDGQRAVGLDALSAYLQSGSRPWRTVGQVLTTPGLRRVALPVHDWLARHRGRLPGGTPATELPRVTATIKGIRRRRTKDLGACARLLRVVYSDGQYPVHWPDAPRAWLSDADVIDAWVVERQGEILGHIALSKVGLDPFSALRWRELTGHLPPELARVSRFFVRPLVRRRGIGAALLDVAVAEIRRRGLIPVVDVVSTSADAIKLFEDRDWRLLAMYPWGGNADRLKIFYYAAPPTSALTSA